MVNENPNLHHSATIDIVLRDSRKTRISHLFAKYPSVCVCLAFVFAIICMMLAIPNMTLAEDNQRAYLVWDDIRVKRHDSYEEAKEIVEVENQKTSNIEKQTENVDDWVVWILYKAKSSNILTQASLNEMSTLETKISQNKRYPHICLREYESGNAAPVCNVSKYSPVSIFADRTSQSTIDARNQELLNSSTLYQDNKTYFQKTWSTSSPSPKWARTLIKHGGPLDIDGRKYRYYKEDEDKQDEYFIDYVLDVYDIVDDFDSANLDIYFFNFDWFNYQTNVLAMRDFAYVGLSLLFVIVYMMIHTRSVLLPLIGMLQVVFAFPIAFCIYRYILQVTYFDLLSLLSIFVILGIAADDIFVFVDAWNQSKEHEILMTDLERRISWVYRRAAHAMFITTLTTFCAFLATSLSDIMPIAAFGIFSACVIASNYLLVITAFPGVVVLREKGLTKYREWKAKRNGQDTEAAKRAEKEANYTPAGTTAAIVATGAATKSNPDNTASNVGRVTQEDVEANVIPASPVPMEEEKMSKFDRFCFSKYSSMVKKGRFFVLGFFLIWFILSCIFAAQLSPPTEAEKWVPEGHWLMKGQEAIEDHFPRGANDDAQKVIIMWGVEGLDKDTIDDPWDPEDVGKLIWDTKFNPSTTTNQNRLKDICTSLKSDKYSNLITEGSDSVHCFVPQFEQYLTSINLTYPVAEADFATHLTNFLANGEYGTDTRNLGSVGISNGKIYYIFFRAIGKGDQGPKSVLHPRWEEWEEVVDELNNGSGVGLNDAFQTSLWWTWYMSEQTLVDDAVQGMLIAGSVSFAILVFTTQNVILSFFAIVCIVGIVTSVMSIVFFNGWDFGTAESVAVVILIGFSVDYVVHICHAYVASHHKSKDERTRDALAKMAISIVGGAITTFGDGCMLFFTVLIFFQKFAWIVTSTIFFALIWSLIFFPALLFAIGPQEDTGNLKVFFKGIYQKYKESKAKK